MATVPGWLLLKDAVCKHDTIYMYIRQTFCTGDADTHSVKVTLAGVPITQLEGQ